ncbi:hypothetical protein CONLIGDRAFT_626497 [Coniochaeta ligniaria NRRL 30616]|uniref:Uncharacterized protein n=1 Tax=Coniochaeta ligniaria NRRL 30616 TaxID=1408157 RepID=A0A1J7J532_9PEZI|nr:hypothetical protein CONLIGDRAFT_626497 [Coniochaeta ligniaria NRRL 30616]
MHQSLLACRIALSVITRGCGCVRHTQVLSAIVRMDNIPATRVEDCLCLSATSVLLAQTRNAVG